MINAVQMFAVLHMDVLFLSKIFRLMELPSLTGFTLHHTEPVKGNSA